MRPLALALLLAGCATAPRPASLGDGWQPVRSGGFHHADGGTIATNKVCGEADDVPLDVLTNHLLFGVEHKQEHARTPFMLAGRAALRTRLDATLDGVAVALDLVVLKKDGCTFDLMLIARPDALARRQPDFDRFVAGFQPGGAR